MPTVNTSRAKPGVAAEIACAVGMLCGSLTHVPTVSNTTTPPNNYRSLIANIPTRSNIDTSLLNQNQRIDYSVGAFVNQLYRIKESQQVLSYLDSNPSLIPILLDIPSAIEPYFPDTILSLEVFVNAETVGDSNLVVLIHTKYTPALTLDKLDEFNDNFGYNVTDSVEGKLTFNVEFQ